jgi:hypothetical protein
MFKSELRPGGAEYTRLKPCPLKDVESLKLKAQSSK